MILAICGPSGSGKSTFAKEFVGIVEDAKEIVMTTTRAPRPGEVDRVDYHFVSNELFDEWKKQGHFIYTEEYSGGRNYGLHFLQVLGALHDNDSVYVLVTTPGGIRSLKNYVENYYKESPEVGKSVLDNLTTICLETNLGNRVKRYIDRCGDGFNYDDMAEISARVNRDFGMFLGIEKEVDAVLPNNSRVDMNESICKLTCFIPSIRFKEFSKELEEAATLIDNDDYEGDYE